ncbi:MAG: response regulator, partial [Thermodesulfovibrionales bacterium]
FKIYLPLAQCPQSFQRGQQGQRILIVDDEIEMLNFVKDLLESHGYSVITMNDPLQVHKMDKEMINEIDLLITDIMMPHINGKELIRYFKSVKPSIKVIAISAHDIWNIGKRDSDIDAFVSKPFEAVYLLSVVGRVMESQGQWVNIQ